MRKIALAVNKSKQKGTAWETEIVNYLKSFGFDARRKVLSGNADKGDIEIIELPFLVIEAKNERKYSLSEYIAEANEEATNADVELGVAWMHRQGKASPKDAYVLMDGETFRLILSMLKTKLYQECSILEG